MPDTTDLTADPGETIRTGARSPRSAPLPTLSVDLRKPPSVGAEPGADLEIRGVIGEGGMGRVLLARQHSLSRDVAVKTVKPDASENARAAIILEGAITGQLEHPAIVPVHALGLDTAGWPALVMKRVEGVSWQELIDDPAHAGWEGWEGDAAMRMPGHVQILESVCNALHFAHSRGIVHRDVKPANVLIGAYGDVYLADWGVAGEVGSRASGVCGTPAFLAPEMVTGGVVDARTDVYLLGSTLHLILTGRFRHPGSSVTETLEQARVSAPYAFGPEVPPELGALVNRACDPNPDQRPDSARAFRDALKVFGQHRQAVALGAQAIARLEQLEALLALPEHDASQREKTERLLAEARFGLEQSLGQWNENAAARAALARVEAILEQRRQALLALEAESRQRDPRHASGWRTAGLATLVGLTIAMLALASRLTGRPEPVHLLIFPGALLVVLAIGGFLNRKTSLSTKFNRQAFAGLFLSIGLIEVARLAGFAFETPVAVQFSRDAFMLACCAAFMRVSFFRWAWVPAVAFAAAGALCVGYPDRAMDFFSAASIGALAFGALASSRENRRAQPA